MADIPFGVPAGSVKTENPDGIGIATGDATSHNLYDGKMFVHGGPLSYDGDGDGDNDPPQK